MMKYYLMRHIHSIKKYPLIFFLTVLLQNVNAQQKIDLIEYSIDAVPPYGQGTQVTVSSPVKDLSNFSFNADISGVSPGVHVLFVRSRSTASGSSGEWSITNSRYFYIYKGSGTLSKIKKLEYFIDTDPGEGKATPITVTPASDISGIAFSPDIAALGNGFHELFIRSLDANGLWSISNYKYFFKANNIVPAVSKIQKLEYFIDTDPGEGKATTITVTPATQVSGVTFNPNIGALGNGFHVLFIRSLDQNGKWSITNYIYFYKMNNVTPALSKIKKLEYFIDTDPGEGKAKTITVTPATNISGLGFNADMTGIAAGFHVMYIRSLDANGKWSVTNNTYFFKSYAGPKDTANIVKIEYFIDNDPGIGFAKNIPISPAHDIANKAFTSTNLDTLASGTHYLFIRSLDSKGFWSLTAKDTFRIGSLPVTLLNFTAKADKLSALLNWQTASEINSNHFDVERSIDGVQFTKVGAVTAKGNTASLSSYQFEDVNVGSGTWFYRLKMVDNDARFAYSKIDRVVIGAVNNFIVYPNPAKNVIHILLNEQGKIQIKLFAPNGQLLLSAETIGVQNKDLNVSGLSNGMYILQVMSATQTHNQKIIIQH